VPPSALVRNGGGPADAQVFVVRSGKAERLGVTLGTEQPDAVQVSAGLSAGDVVVLEPPSALAPGAAVQAQAH
jgi:hypothetical protein